MENLVRPKLQGTRKKLGLDRKCPPGKILRAPYMRKFSNTVKKRGYTVQRKNKTIHIYPKANAALVKAECITNRGLSGKGTQSGKVIGSLNKGSLKKYGYNAHVSKEERHKALKKAIAEYGPLTVFRKLAAVAALTIRTVPEAHKIFVSDQKWIEKNYTLKKNA